MARESSRFLLPSPPLAHCVTLSHYILNPRGLPRSVTVGAVLSSLLRWLTELEFEEKLLRLFVNTNDTAAMPDSVAFRASMICWCHDC